MRSSFALVARLAFSACLFGCSASPRVTPPSPRATPLPGARSQPPPRDVIRCEEPPPSRALGAELDRKRRDAIEALVGGEPRRAARGFVEVLVARPNDVPSLVLREAAVRDLRHLHADDARLYASLEARTVTGLLTGPTTKKAVVAPVTPAPTLSIVAVEKRPPPRPDADPDALLPGDASGFAVVLPRGDGASRAFVHADHRLTLFGDHALGIARSERSRPTLVELAPLVTFGATSPSGPRHGVVAAQVVGRTLVVGLAQAGVEATPPPTTGYVVAIDLASGEIAWVSEPGVSSAYGFVVSGSHVIAGFGARGHRGSLTVLDLATGKTESRLELAHAPSTLEIEHDRIAARSDDAPDEVTTIALSTGLTPAPAATLEQEDLVTPPRHAEGTACVLRRGAAALDARDPKAAASELLSLPMDARGYGDVLDAAAAFVARADAGDPDVVDLSVPAPVAAKPPFFTDAAVASVRARPGPAGASSRLVQRSVLRYGPGEGRERLLEGRSQVSESLPLPEAPGLSPADEASVTFTAPETYGVASLWATHHHGDDNLLVYDQRYVAVLTGHRTRAVLDLGPAPYAGGPLQLAVKGDTLFVSVIAEGPSSVTTGGPEAIAAYDLVTGEQRWRTEPHVASAGFVVYGDDLVAARGFGQEKASLAVVRTDTGEITARAPLRSAPRLLTRIPDSRGRDDRGLSVACANEIVLYDVSPRAQP